MWVVNWRAWIILNFSHSLYPKSTGKKQRKPVWAIVNIINAYWYSQIRWLHDLYAAYGAAGRHTNIIGVHHNPTQKRRGSPSWRHPDGRRRVHFSGHGHNRQIRVHVWDFRSVTFIRYVWRVSRRPKYHERNLICVVTQIACWREKYECETNRWIFRGHYEAFSKLFLQRLKISTHRTVDGGKSYLALIWWELNLIWLCEGCTGAERQNSHTNLMFKLVRKDCFQNVNQ